MSSDSRLAAILLDPGVDRVREGALHLLPDGVKLVVGAPSGGRAIVIEFCLLKSPEPVRPEPLVPLDVPVLSRQVDGDGAAIELDFDDARVVLLADFGHPFDGGRPPAAEMNHHD